MYRLKTHESGAHVGIDHIYSFFSISGDAVCIRSESDGGSSKEQEMVVLVRRRGWWYEL